MREAERLENADEILELPISYVEKGKKIGKEEGLEEGREEGIEIGILRSKKEFVLTLLQEGFDVEKIATLTKLPLQEVKGIQKTIQK